MIWYLLHQGVYEPYWVLGGTPTHWYDPSSGYIPKRTTHRVIGITVTCDRTILKDTKQRILRNLAA